MADASSVDATHDLFMATIVQDVAEAEAALRSGAAANHGNEAGMTPLHVACAGTSPVEMIQLLLRSGADAAARDAGGWTGLIYASSGGQLGIVNELLESDSPAIHAATTGTPRWTALGRACHRGHDDVVERLVGAILASSGAEADEITSESTKGAASAGVAGSTEASDTALPELHPHDDLRIALDVARARGHKEAAALVTECAAKLGVRA